MEIMILVIPIVLSAFALGLSVTWLICTLLEPCKRSGHSSGSSFEVGPSGSSFEGDSSDNSSEDDYSEELCSRIELSGSWDTQEISAEKDAFQFGVDKLLVSIEETDDLERAYIIYANNRVERLGVDDMERVLEKKIENSLTASPDLKVGNFEYRYFFVYLEIPDDSNELHLVFTKVVPGLPEAKNLKFGAISGIEVFGLGNERHENAEEYAGEKIMAEEYVRILEELPRYMGQ